MKKFYALILIAVLVLSACKDISNTPVPETSEADLNDLNNGEPLLLEPDISEADEIGEASENLEEVEAIPVFSPLPSLANPPEAEIFSKAVYMYNFEADVCVYALNENEKLPPASIAKIMTFIIVLENVPDLWAPIKVTEEAFAEFYEYGNNDRNKEDPAMAGFVIGQDNLNYYDAIYGLMLASGCDAANILAYNTCLDLGSSPENAIETFIDLMNEKALELGCLNTNFKNASGLYEAGYYTTAYDMFLIAKYALDNFPLFMETCKTDEREMPANDDFPDGYNVKRGKKTLPDYATGLKTGGIYEYFDYEDGGKRYDGFTTFVSYAEKNGTSYLTVTLGADYYNEERKAGRYYLLDHEALYDWAFSTFHYD